MTSLQKDSLLGNYKIINKIGEGGMAEIYKAEQPALKRFVVIKKLKDPNREIIARFKKEALLSASFSQENVTPIYDFIYSGRSYYLIMEYIEGEDLRTIIDYGSPLPVEIAVLIALEIARGLEYTHSQNIIHRDIKPSNILISYNGRVKLIDFGVAKDDTNTRLTMTGLIVGTPAYMSPEQAHGDPLSPQSDLYALGILLYEMLTGVKPFFGANNTEILAKIVRSRYTPAQRINPEIPWKLRRILKKVLKKEKKRRYKNASGFIHDLEKVISWQVRSNRNSIIEKYVKNLDKTSGATSEDTLKTLLLEKNKDWGWKALNFLIVFSFLISAVFINNQFFKNETGFLQINPQGKTLSLTIDKRPKGTIDRLTTYGPFLTGHKRIRAENKDGSSMFVAYPLIHPNDTLRIPVVMLENSRFSELNIVSEPAYARVFIDGIEIAQTPLEKNIEVQPGTYRLEIQKTGFHPFSGNIEITSAKSYFLQIELEPL